MTKHYKDAVGVDIILDCGADITGATDTKIKVEKPDGTEVEWAATIYNSNYLKYTTVADDLDQEGVYKMQAYLTLSGFTGAGDTVSVRVYDEYK